jgi:prepilin peptidase CpaA
MGLAFLIYFPLYLLRGMGAGDVKLMAAVGAIAGPLNWLGIMVLTALFGGVAAIVLVTAKGRVHKTFENIRMILLSARHLQAPYDANPDLDVHSSQGLRLPHAVVIAFGTFGFLLAAGIWAPR